MIARHRAMKSYPHTSPALTVPAGFRRYLPWLSFVWVGVCLSLMRQPWQVAGAEHWVVAGEMAAGLPLLAWWAVLRFSGDAPPRESPSLAWSILLTAGLLRLILIDLPPAQSDDLYRYIWEGRIQWAGFNPFALAPNAPELAHLRDELWPLINHPHMPTIYPPLTQWAFALGAKIGQWPEQWPNAPIVGMKLVFTLCDLAVLGLLMAWLRRRGKPIGWAALWAYHPLVIVEFSGNGHLDSLMAIGLTASLLALDRGGRRREATPSAKTSFLALAGLMAAILAKLIPVLLVPFYARRLGRRWWWLGAMGLVGMVAFIPFWDAGNGLLTSAKIYGATWCGNDPAFELIKGFCGGNGYTARQVFWALLLGLIGLLWFLRWPPWRAALPVLGAYFVLGPMVHPWYLTLLIPMIAVGGGPWPWVWLTWAVPLAYLEPQGWTAWTIWGVFWGGLFAQGVIKIYTTVKYGHRQGTPPEPDDIIPDDNP